MWDSRLDALFVQLDETEYKAADSLAEILKISSKTVRKRLKELDEVLRKSGAEIETQYGSGYRLKITSESFFEDLSRQAGKEQSSQYLSLPENRVSFLLEYLLHRRDYVKMDDLSETVYVSRKTLSADLKMLEKTLEFYHLKLDRRPNHGIKITGSEFDLRLCMANTIVHHHTPGLTGMENLEEKQRMEILTRLVEEILRRQNLHISDVLFQNLIVHIYIALKRMEKENYVPMESVSLVDITGTKAYETAEQIGQQLRETFFVTFAESEVQYIAIHLSGKQYWKESEENLVITQEISDLVLEMLGKVYEAFRFDFREDLELRMTLSQHIVPLTVRLRYGMKIQNPMVKEIKERFSLAFAMASHGATVFIKAYQTILTDEEIGYLALAFALAIERQRTAIQKKNILLVCSSGIGSARLMQYRYEELFGPYIDRIATCDVGRLSQIDFSQFDYVFSTVPIGMKIPIPIQEVKCFLGEGDIQKIKSYLAFGSGCLIQQYFDRELFLPQIKAKSREDVLRQMADHIRSIHSLPETFYDAVLEREALAPTAFGNLVAMPHPNYTVSRKTLVCVGILKEPILWGEVPVHVVFLVSIGEEKDENLKLFYRIVSEYLLRGEHIRQLIADGSYEGMIHQLQQIEIKVAKEEQ